MKLGAKRISSTGNLMFIEDTMAEWYTVLSILKQNLADSVAILNLCKNWSFVHKEFVIM